MSEADAVGLRERKKRATKQAIERGAIELALEHGYENVTVEMICESAMISQRTFFNYAGSKERAVLGIDTPLPGEALRKEYIAGQGGSPLQDLIATMVAAFSPLGGVDAALFGKRHQIVQANPGLALKEFARMEEAQTSIVELVDARLRSDDSARDRRGVEEEARMIVSMTFGITHYLARDLIASGSFDNADELLQRAIALARKVVTD